MTKFHMTRLHIALLTTAAATVSACGGGGGSPTPPPPPPPPANSAPDAAFSASATQGAAPLIVSFDASGSTDADGDALSYAWDFGDGSTASGVTASHSFEAGEYTVGLSVSDGRGGTDDASEELSVSAPEREATTLRAAADANDMDVGIYIDYWRTNPANSNYDADYTRELDTVGGAEFDIVTMGTYQVSVNYDRDVWTFTEQDIIADYAERHDMKIHGHPLVYGQDNVIAPWLRDARDAEDWPTVRAAMEETIDRLAGRYKGRVAVWDVVNEAVEWDGTQWTYRPTPFQRAHAQDGAPGYTYLDTAFRRARAVDPDAKLIYNDYSNLEGDGKADFTYEMVRGMIARGVPIDGIGFQAHIGTDGRDTGYEEGELDAERAAANMRRFADLGLELFVTELDMYTRGTSDQELEFQAKMFTRVTDLCREEPACNTVQVWGFHDEYTWLDEFHGTGKTYPLMWDEETEKKPSYFAVRDALGK